MKIILACMFCLFSIFTYSQELNIGAVIGTSPSFYSDADFTFGGTLEFRPRNSVLSINMDPFLFIRSNEMILTAPLFIKFIIGNKIRFCPSFGGFIRSNANYGWKTGIGIEYKIKKSLLIFADGNLYMDYYKTERRHHDGSSSSLTDRQRSFWISIGIRKNILK